MTEFHVKVSGADDETETLVDLDDTELAAVQRFVDTIHRARQGGFEVLIEIQPADRLATEEHTVLQQRVGGGR